MVDLPSLRDLVERQIWREKIDSLPRRLVRLARVADRIGLVAEPHLERLPALAWLALRRGVGVRTIHAIHALRTPDRLALVDAHRSLTYRELEAEIAALAAGLSARLGVGRGTPVVLMSDNRAEYLVTWQALTRLGARAIHASYRMRPAELRYVLDHSNARIALVSEASHEAAASCQRDEPERNLRLLLASSALPTGAGALRWEELLQPSASPPADAAVRTLETESVVYTSGTTGRPKGAVRDFARYGAIELSRVLERLAFRQGDRHLVVSPLYHSGAQAFVLIQTALGATLYLEPHFEAEPTLSALSRHAIHSVFLVPTMIRRILELGPELFLANPTPELRGIVSGAAEFPTALREAAIRRFGAAHIFDFYGATELGWVTLIDGTEMLAHPGSVGRALAGQEIAIFDRDGRTLPVGETGLVYVRNEQTMSGYLHDRKASDETRRGEWVTVEDLGYLDRDGYLFLAGRARDMVISGGVNIYPTEIEEVLARHPSIREVAVIGVPDEEWGERLVAVVVPRADGFDAAEVEEWARAELAGAKVPRRWELVSELPRNPTGKVLKTELRARFAPPAR
ncbi:MAG: AMP-binding protein [Polyangiaceae bacterium]|nr:AMP-binding protein [Polyangiaceae bacterium]